MPKQHAEADIRAAVAAGDPPTSCSFDDDDNWHEAQQAWLSKWCERRLPDGQARRRKWDKCKELHARLLNAAADKRTPQRRQYVQRPQPASFETAEQFEDAMGEHGLQRDARRQSRKAELEGERRATIRTSEHAEAFAEREADRKRASRRLTAALAAAGDKDSKARQLAEAEGLKRRRVTPEHQASKAVREQALATRKRREKQQDLLFALEELLATSAEYHTRLATEINWGEAVQNWRDDHMFGAVLAWADDNAPDGEYDMDAWEDGVIAVAIDAARARVGRLQVRIGAPVSLEKAFASQVEGCLGFTRWPASAYNPDVCMGVAWRAQHGYCVCGCKPMPNVWNSNESGWGTAPECLVHNCPAWT